MYVICLDTVLNFGKHKGEQVEDLLDDDPGYLAWLYDEGYVFDLDVERKMEDMKIILKK